MTITEYRKARNLSMEQFGALLSRSKGHMSEIERLNRCSAKLALEIERQTAGQVSAASLNDEVAAARRQAA
jgi:DNA-binding transcriptional regulator YdaS (Cro superfamily)